MLTVAASAVAAHADENAEEHADVRPDGDEHALATPAANSKMERD
jgi:hypothetical protein